MERRLAEILAADVVGYSRLMEADEEATPATLNAYREVIDTLVADHHSRVFGSAGDSIIAEYTSPVEAVCCAVEIQQEIEARNVSLPEDCRMRFRIGGNLGDVIVKGEDVYGGRWATNKRLPTAGKPLTDLLGVSLGRPGPQKRKRVSGQSKSGPVRT